MLSNKKLGRLLLSEKYLYFNFWSLFLPCPTNKEPGCESSSTIAVIAKATKVGLVCWQMVHFRLLRNSWPRTAVVALANLELMGSNPADCRSLRALFFFRNIWSVLNQVLLLGYASLLLTKFFIWMVKTGFKVTNRVKNGDDPIVMLNEPWSNKQNFLFVW